MLSQTTTCPGPAPISWPSRSPTAAGRSIHRDHPLTRLSDQSCTAAARLSTTDVEGRPNELPRGGRLRCGFPPSGASGWTLLTGAIAERIARFARLARVHVPAAAGALRSRLYAAKAVREERSADDGSIELLVELPDVELLVLARTPGVQILEVRGPDMPCAPGDAYLQSTAVSSATTRAPR